MTNRCMFRKHKWSAPQVRGLIERIYSNGNAATESQLHFQFCLRCGKEVIHNPSSRQGDLAVFFEHATLPDEYRVIDYGSEGW